MAMSNIKTNGTIEPIQSINISAPVSNRLINPSAKLTMTSMFLYPFLGEHTICFLDYLHHRRRDWFNLSTCLDDVKRMLCIDKCSCQQLVIFCKIFLLKLINLLSFHPL